MPENFREKVTLGRTGLQVARLGIGSGYGVPAASVEKAFHEYGVNYFYLSSPRRGPMKKAMANLAETHRDDIVIVLQTYDHLGMMMKKYHHKGLKQLGIDYADILLLGWFNSPPGDRVLEPALKLKEEGKVRYLAMSGHNRKTFGKMAQMPDNPVDIFMVRYNAVHSGAEKDIFPHMPEDNRPGMTIYTATCWRKLMNPKKMPPGEQPLTAVDAYRFVLSNPHADLCMTGPRNAAEMDENLKTLDLGPMTDEEMARVRKIGDHIYGKVRA